MGNRTYSNGSRRFSEPDRTRDDEFFPPDMVDIFPSEEAVRFSYCQTGDGTVYRFNIRTHRMRHISPSKVPKYVRAELASIQLIP